MRELFFTKNENSHSEAFQRMVDIFHQKALTSIQRDDAKLRTYSLLKLKPGFENYLSEIKSIKERTALTKFRLSNHLLMIEKGRHKDLDRTERFCPFCPKSIEDEIHFLLNCKTYQHLRCEFLENTKKHVPHFLLQSDAQNFYSLMKNAPQPTSQFIYRISELREFLLRKHRTPG